MSTSKDISQLQNTKLPYKCVGDYNSFQVHNPLWRCKIISKYVRVAAEIVASIIFASCFFVVSVWIMNVDYSVFLHKHELAQKPRNPAIVWYTPEVGVPLNKEIKCSNGSHIIKCDVFLRQSQPDEPEAYLFYAPFLEQFPLPREPGVLWGLLHDETPLNNLVFMHEQTLSLFNFSATFNRHSDVPFPLMAMRGLESLTDTRYFVKTQKKNKHLSTLGPVMYLQTNTYTSTDRDTFVKALMMHIQVDAYGESLHNKDLPINQIYTDPIKHGDSIYKKYMYDPELLQFIGRYKFILTIENAACDDYVSEKLWRALELGVVPIYFGSPLVRDWLPNNKSAILVEDYPTPELLSQYLFYLLQNDTAYDEYLTHKTLRRISNQKLIDEIKTRPYQNNLKATIEKFECFLCERLHGNRSNQVNVMTKKHYNCPIGVTAVFSIRDSNVAFWKWLIQFTTGHMYSVFEEIHSSDRTSRHSKASFRQNKTLSYYKYNALMQ